MNKTILASVMAVFLFSGCSTIVNGSKENISFSSKEEGTKLYVNGNYHGKDYANLTLKRGQHHSVIAKKEGCEPRTLTTDYHFQWGKSLFLNVLLDWGIISIPTDLITGSAWETEQSHYDVTPECTNIAKTI